VTRRWLAECVEREGGAPLGLLLLGDNLAEAATRIRRAITATTPGGARVRACLPERDRTGTTARMPAFDAAGRCWATAANCCHVKFVVGEGREVELAQALERMPEVGAYAQNHNLGIFIPHARDGEPGRYRPDFLVKIEDGLGTDDLLNVVVGASGPA